MARKDKSKKPSAGFREPAGGEFHLNPGETDGKDKPSLHELTTLNQKEGFLDTLHRHMTAVVFAEAGDFVTAKHYLGAQPGPKSVLLVIEGDVPDPAAFSYGLGLCTRMNAELDILQVIQKTDDDGDYQLLSEKMVNGSLNLVNLVRMAEQMKIPFKVTMRIGDVSEKLINYAKRHKDVVMIILDSPHTKGPLNPEKSWDRFLGHISRELSVPITTVLPKSPAFASQ
ncbi:MAG: hypothetical protein V2B18_22845 [Pseudomonadota bacterium]